MKIRTRGLEPKRVAALLAHDLPDTVAIREVVRYPDPMIELWHGTSIPLTELRHIRDFDSILDMLNYFREIPDEETYGHWEAFDVDKQETILSMDV